MTTHSTPDNNVCKEVRLTFAPDISNEPVVCQLVRDYDIFFNILKAQIGPRKEGNLTLELIGAAQDIERGIAYLKERGVKVVGLNQKISFHEELCMHCGMCTSVCKVDALYVDKNSRLTQFVLDRCISCGLCTKVCPVGAMQKDEEYKTM